MDKYIEALILYIVLFFAGTAGSIAGGTAQAADFSVTAEIMRILLYSIPSLALIWYLIFKAGRLENSIIRPGKKDLLSGLITLPCLFIIGFAVIFVSSHIGGSSAQAPLHNPSTGMGWIVLCISNICAAYLEESYFRYYLLTRRDEFKLNAASALMLSTALFSICHIYEGPWGFLNAALSGTFLGFIFLRYNSLHGIAIAHGLYNVLVYVLNSVVF